MGGDRDLEEVERALSVLDGRHPETVRAQREAAAAAAKRAQEHQAAAAAERRRARRRVLIGALALAAIGAAGFVAFRYHEKRAAADAEVAPLVARYVALGFDALPRGSFSPEDHAELSTIAGDCYALVAARGAQLRIERPIGTAGAKAEALLCTCAAEQIAVSAGGAPVRVLHIAGAALGGTRAVPYRFSDAAPTVIAGDDACSDDALAAYARDGRYPKQDQDGAFLAAHPALGEAGFTTVASAKASLPFVFVPGAASSCFVADGADLTLWTLEGGVQKPIAHEKGAIGWCAVKAATFVVEGSAERTVVSAPSRRIGGLVGLREIGKRARLPTKTWIRDDERGEISADTLRAAVVPDPVAIGSQTIEAAQTKDARVLVFSSPTAETFTSNEADFRCHPPLSAGDAVCVQARALTWHDPPPGVAAGAAYGPLPYWMSALADSPDARSEKVDAELALVGFARRMAARGFVPGVIEGVTERDDSVEVLGRSGDDAVVAVGLWPAPPYIHPYSDGAPWTLEGEPRVIPLAGGVRVTLRTPGRPNVAIGARRTVVFRHSVK